MILNEIVRFILMLVNFFEGVLIFFILDIIMDIWQILYVSVNLQ